MTTPSEKLGHPYRNLPKPAKRKMPRHCHVRDCEGHPVATFRSGAGLCVRHFFQELGK